MRAAVLGISVTLGQANQEYYQQGRGAGVDHITALPTCGPAQVSPNEEPALAPHTHGLPYAPSTLIAAWITSQQLGRPAALACDYGKWWGNAGCT
jgi:hypothetical protein